MATLTASRALAQAARMRALARVRSWLTACAAACLMCCTAAVVAWSCCGAAFMDTDGTRGGGGSAHVKRKERNKKEGKETITKKNKQQQQQQGTRAWDKRETSEADRHGWDGDKTLTLPALPAHMCIGSCSAVRTWRSPSHWRRCSASAPRDVASALRSSLHSTSNSCTRALASVMADSMFRMSSCASCVCVAPPSP